MLGSVLIRVQVKKTETSVAISNRRNLTQGIGYMSNGMSEKDRERECKGDGFSLSNYMKKL